MNIIIDILKYFLEPVPQQSQQARLAIVIATAIIFALSILLRLLIKKYKEDKILRKLFKNLPGKIQNIAVALGLHAICRYLGIPFGSMRIVAYIIFGTLLYVLINAIIIYKKEYPEIKMRKIQQTEKNKYLPGKKRK